jgi:RNA polymerase sigma-70 factor (ECF subfamily)
MEQSASPGQPSAITSLTTRMAARDEEAFREFHSLYFSRLLRYHIIIARGDEHAAHEALQETLLRVVRHARRFDDEEVFWCWLTVLARSSASDAGRKRNRYWQLLAGYARSLLHRNEIFPPAETDRELREMLDQSITELDTETRALVEGKYLRRATVRELAAETGLTEKAVESKLLRARRELRENVLTKLRHENT